MIGLDGEKMTLTKVTNVGQSIKFGHRMQQSCCVGNFALSNMHKVYMIR